MDGIAVSALDFEPGERFFPLRRELGVSTFGINAIRLAPGQRGRIHRHARQEEVYVVLEGTLTLLVEQEAIELRPMQVVRVAAELRRQLVNRHPQALVLLALGGAEPHEGRDGEAFSDWSDKAGAPPQEIPMPQDVPTRG